MKYRDYKTFRPGNYYHVYNRGVNKQKIFLDDADFVNYQKRMRIVLGLDEEYNKNPGSRALRQGSPLAPLRIQPFLPNTFSIANYCLIENHPHFCIGQNTDTGIGKFILKLNTSYSMYFNRKYGHVGQLFQDTFKAKLIDTDSYFKYLSAYIHNNPDDPEHYPYSSFLDIIGERNDNICDKKIILGMFDNDPLAYKNFVLNFKHDKLGQAFMTDFIFEDE